MKIPDGFERVDAEVYRKGDELFVTGFLEPGVPFAFGVKLGAGEPEDPAAAWGPPPDGFRWTGEERPPKKGEYFWSEIRGEVVRAVMDETGVNQFGEPTGGRRILVPVEPPASPRKPGLRLVK